MAITWMVLLTFVSPAQDGEEVRRVYQIEYPKDFKGDRKEIVRKTRDVIAQRIKHARLKGLSLTTRGEDNVVLEFAGRDAEEMNRYYNLLTKRSGLELRIVAPSEIRNQWSPGEPLPAGWLPFGTRHGGETLLCSKETVITGADVQSAFARRFHFFDETAWIVFFELTDEGREKFDAVAAKLYDKDENRRGSIAIILDDRVLSAPIVNSEAFHGVGEISGAFDQAQAEDLAILLRSGELPFPLKLVEEK